ncbi:MAG: DPP IV N-terminal domain-containing protein, partial [Prevotellaceae bacterium]|nr:DPP IV N-terminal domain-containing protein [Prevotellaceae bacterium]
MNAQNKLTLEDLIKGGYNYDNVKVRDLDLKWDGEKILEAKTPQEEDTIAVIKDFNLFVNGKQLTSDGSREIVYGESVHRNEFGIDGGLFWSPDKSRLAFYRMDQSMVTDYPQVDINGNATTHSAIYIPDKYPMAGETSHEVTIGVYDLKTEKLVYLNVGNPKDRYFTNVCWSPDNSKIYLFEVNRDQTDTSLDCYDVQTGEKLSTLYTEHNDKYVE